MAAKRDLRGTSMTPINSLEHAIVSLATNPTVGEYLSFSTLIASGNPSIRCLEAALAAGIPAWMGVTVEEYKKKKD